jgi:superoxide oxidase
LPGTFHAAITALNPVDHAIDIHLNESTHMGLRNNTERYGSLSIGLHWFMLFLLAAVYACMEFRGYFPKGSEPRELMKTWHYMLGISVLILVIVRIAVNLFAPKPKIVPTPPAWQMLLANLMKLALYVLMLAMPILGWLILNGSGDAVPFFGLVLPTIVGENEGLVEFVEEIHEIGATVGYVLIGVHAFAGLYHHYFMKDNTLLRILPTRKKD